MASKNAELKDFVFKPGQLINIMLNPDDRSFNAECLYVGMLPNQTLIMTPQTATFPRLEKDHKLIVRITTSDGNILFVAQVSNMTGGAQPIIFLQKPSSIKHTINDSIGSMGLALPILASNEDTGARGITGTLDNLNINKARLTLDKPLGDPDQDVIVKAKFVIGRVNKSVSLKARILNEEFENDRYLYHIALDEKDESTFLVLFGFIFSETSR